MGRQHFAARIRFSLRTLLFAALMAGAAPGWWGWNLRAAHLRHQLLAQPGVHAWGARPSGDEPNPWVPTRAELGKLPLGLWMVGEWSVPEIELVHFGGVRFADEDVRRFRLAFPEARVWLVRPADNAIIPVR